jgi:hypothetical protein
VAIDLKKLSKGRQDRPARVLLFGLDGTGKTTMAAGSPNPFFIDANKGSHKLDVQRVIPDTWDEVQEWVQAVERGDVKCDTLVLDTLGDLEGMSHKALFGSSNVAEWQGGWGRGDQEAIAKWREFLNLLERVWNKGKGIVMVGHATVTPFNDPAGPAVDRYTVACRPRLAGLLRGWCDYVLFTKEDVHTQKVDGREKGVSTGIRYIHTKRTPAYDAKARGTSLFPDKLLLSWREFDAAVRGDEERFKALTGEIEAILKEIADPALDKVVKEFLRANPNAVVETRNRVAAKLEEKKQQAAAPSAEKAAS